MKKFGSGNYHFRPVTHPFPDHSLFGKWLDIFIYIIYTMYSTFDQGAEDGGGESRFHLQAHSKE